MFEKRIKGNIILIESQGLKIFENIFNKKGIFYLILLWLNIYKY